MPNRRPVIFFLLVGLLAGCRDPESSPAVVAKDPPASSLRSDAPPGEVNGPMVTGPVWFRTIEGVGIDFRHASGTSPVKPFPAANGSGLAAFDYDLDGRSDLYFATGTPFPLDADRSQPADRFYRNVDAWTFEDVTQRCGLGHNGYGAGVTYGDFDNDGFPDVYVACYGANVLYRNQGDGTFTKLDEASGMADPGWATSAAMLDYDGDGLLDIYVCNYGQWTLEENRWCGDRSRDLRYYCSPLTVKPAADALLRNLGDDRFEDRAADVGLAQRPGRSQGVVAADLDGNGTIDLYVGNDLNANSMFLNQGHGMFADASEASGVAYDYLGGMQAGMGVDAADVSGDGLPELFVTNFEGEHNAYYENLGSGQFQEVSQQRGLYAAGLPWVGWGTALADFDLDGRLDLVVINGHVDENRPDVDHAQPALLYHNTGGGRFALVGEQAGDYFQQPHTGRALAVADLDNDGDQDLVMGHRDGPPSLLCNERYRPGLSSAAEDDGRRSISIRLVGTQSNRDAIGSTLTLRAGDHRQVLQVKGGGSYLSAHDPRKLFAVPADVSSVDLNVRWPDGSVSELNGVQPGGSYTVIQPLASEDTVRSFSQGGQR